MTIEFDKAAIKARMNDWRAGFGALPQEYNRVHEAFARADAPEMAKALGGRVLFTEMIKSGWCDGTRFLRALVEDRAGRIHDMRWNDSNGGSWFEKLESGGETLIRVPDNRPGHM